MVVIIILLVLVVLLAALLAAALLGRIPAPGVLPAVSTESFPGLPRGQVEPEDLQALSFDLALRGYRMSQVDAVLARLEEELTARDADIARLRAEVAGDGSGAPGEVDDAAAASGTADELGRRPGEVDRA